MVWGSRLSRKVTADVEDKENSSLDHFYIHKALSFL